MWRHHHTIEKGVEPILDYVEPWFKTIEPVVSKVKMQNSAKKAIALVLNCTIA